LVEAKVGKGKILISGVDLQNNLDNRPEAKQLRNSLINYMNKDIFNPRTELTINDIKQIIK
jgi:hypothetical protein